jgi:hypothetical protein
VTVTAPVVLDDEPSEPTLPAAATVVERPRTVDRPRLTDVTAPLHHRTGESPLRVFARSPVRRTAPAPRPLEHVALTIPAAAAPAPVEPLWPEEMSEPIRLPTRAWQPAMRPVLSSVPRMRRDARLREDDEPSTRNVWPELPPPAVRHDVEVDAALRAWTRARRLDREQAGL